MALDFGTIAAGAAAFAVVFGAIYLVVRKRQRKTGDSGSKGGYRNK